MTHVKYFRISLLIPIIVGALLGLAGLILDLLDFKADFYEGFVIFFIGHVIMAIPYIIFALVVAKLLKSWSARKTIIFIILTPLIFLGVTYIVSILMDLQVLLEPALYISLISSIFYVVIILGGYFTGRKLGWINTYE